MYNVVLLIERELIELDANQVIALHEGVDDDLTFHLLLPVASAAETLNMSLAALGGGQAIPATEPEVLEEVQDEIERSGQEELTTSATLLNDFGFATTATLTDEDPIDALRELVEAVAADEVIVLTEPHVVREFFGLDWTSRARRAIDVPTLHLLEHLPLEAQGEI